MVSAYQNPGDPYKYTVIADSKHGCPTLDYSQIWQFYQDYKIPFGGVFISIGVFVAFFGKRFINITLFLAGFTAVFFAIMALAFGYFVTAETSDGLKWAIVALASILGGIMGFAISRQTAQKVSFFILGAGLGVIVGQLLFTTFFLHMEFAQGNEDVVKIMSMILFGLVTGIVGMYLTD